MLWTQPISSQTNLARPSVRHFNLKAPALPFIQHHKIVICGKLIVPSCIMIQIYTDLDLLFSPYGQIAVTIQEHWN